MTDEKEDAGVEHHAPDHVGGVWCEWCEKRVTVADYNANHGSKICGGNDDE